MVSRVVSHKTAHWFMFYRYLTSGSQHLFLTSLLHGSIFKGFNFCKASAVWAEAFVKTGHKQTHVLINLFTSCVSQNKIAISKVNAETICFGVFLHLC